MSRYRITRKTDGPEPRYRVDGIELFHPHSYPGSKATGEPARDYTEADVDRMVAQAKAGVKTFIGHNAPGAAGLTQPERQIRGKFVNHRKEVIDGLPTAVADLDDADPVMALNLVRGHYPHRSPEFNPNTMELKGVAFLGARDPYFKRFGEVRPTVDKAALDQIKADAREFAVRSEIESDLTALRADINPSGDAEDSGVEEGEAGDNPADQKSQTERLIGVVDELSAQVREALAKVEAQQTLIDLIKNNKPSAKGDGKPGDKPGKTDPKSKEKNPMGDKSKADEAKKEPVGVRDEGAADTSEVTALREANASMAVRIASLENERVKDAIRADITALRSSVVIPDDTADAIVAVCAPIADAKERKSKFEALTKGLRTISVTDPAPEANGDVKTHATGVTDEAVRKMIESATPKEAKAIRSEWDSLVSLRADIDEQYWGNHFIADAEQFIKTNLKFARQS